MDSDCDPDDTPDYWITPPVKRQKVLNNLGTSDVHAVQEFLLQLSLSMLVRVSLLDMKVIRKQLVAMSLYKFVSSHLFSLLLPYQSSHVYVLIRLQINYPFIDYMQGKVDTNGAGHNTAAGNPGPKR